MKDQLNSLNKIEMVDVPPFLFTRVQAKIKEQLTEKLSFKQTAIYFVGLVVILCINMIVLKSSNETNSGDLVQELNLSPTNQLYK